MTASPPCCTGCADTGHVCENHPDRPWGPLCCDQPRGATSCAHGACHCGAGEPCPVCCAPIPADGTGSIAAAFQPGLAPVTGPPLDVSWWTEGCRCFLREDPEWGDVLTQPPGGCPVHRRNTLEDLL